jgi:GNAT superfamily N-acetyltransferase
MRVPDLKIRPRSDADEEALLELEFAAEKFHATGAPQLFHEQTAPTLPPSFPNDTDREILVAELDGVIAGFLDVRVQNVPAREFFSARRVGFVVQVVVAQQRRKLGIGRALMEAAAAWSHDRDCDIIELNVFEFNASARRLYESLGYETQSRTLQLKI